MALKKIREELKEIRYYYSRKEVFDKAKTNAKSAVVELAEKYNQVIQGAPAKLYDLYISLYTNNLTQEAHARELGYTPEYIQMLNKKLLLFLQGKFGENK